MGKRDKIHARLQPIETEFLNDLLRLLRRNVGRRTEAVFLSSQVLPVGWPPGMISELADGFTARAEELVEMYLQLGIDPANTPASIYLATSQACYDTANHHRLCPDGHIVQLLARLAPAIQPQSEHR